MHRMKACRGQAMVEFVIVSPVMLLLVFGTLQFALLYQAKTTLNYATFEAARAGAVQNARHVAIENGFTRAMAAVFTNSATVQEVRDAQARVMNDISNGNVIFQMLNPRPEAFKDFGVDIYNNGVTYIPNDNLMYRPLTKGRLSGVDIRDANLLKLRVTYCYPLYVPLVKDFLIKIMSQPAPSADETWYLGTPDENSPNKVCLDKGRFPINAAATVRMQSPVLDQYANADNTNAKAWEKSTCYKNVSKNKWECP